MKKNLSSEQILQITQLTSVGLATFGHFAQKGQFKLTKEALQKEAEVLATTIENRDISKRATVKPVEPPRSRGPGRTSS